MNFSVMVEVVHRSSVSPSVLVLQFRVSSQPEAHIEEFFVEFFVCFFEDVFPSFKTSSQCFNGFKYAFQGL